LNLFSHPLLLELDPFSDLGGSLEDIEQLVSNSSFQLIQRFLRSSIIKLHLINQIAKVFTHIRELKEHSESTSGDSHAIFLTDGAVREFNSILRHLKLFLIVINYLINGLILSSINDLIQGMLFDAGLFVNGSQKDLIADQLSFGLKCFDCLWLEDAKIVTRESTREKV
jgi:hypothetical protein